MILLIKDNCPFCEEFENKKYSNTIIFKITDGKVNLGDGIMHEIDKKIESLPALIYDNVIEMRVEKIKEKLNLLEA